MTYMSETNLDGVADQHFTGKCGHSNVIKWYFKQDSGKSLSPNGSHGHFCGWSVSPFDFPRFDELYDLRILIETASVERLCQMDPPPDLEALKRQSTEATILLRSHVTQSKNEVRKITLHMLHQAREAIAGAGAG